MRPVAAVIVGYLIFALSAAALFQLSGRPPHAAAPAAFMVLTTIYGICFAALGAYVAQVIARSDSVAPAVGVCALIAIGASVSLAMTWRDGAHWTQWTALWLMAPAALMGGARRRRRARTLR